MNETKGSPSGMPIPEADYYECAPEVHVGSWSPSPAGTPPAHYIKPSQVHVRVGTPPGRVALVRFKSARILDEIIEALKLHRRDVWGLQPLDGPDWAHVYVPEVKALLERARLDALEEAAALHESVSPSSDEERLNNVPGAGAMGAVIEYRDKLRALKKAGPR